MRWRLKARRAHTVLPAGLTLFLAALFVLQDAVVNLPSFVTSASNPMVFVLMTPVPVCTALMTALESRPTEAEETGIRNVRLLDTALVLATVAFTVAAGAALGTAVDSGAAQAAGRNVAFLTGLMLGVRTITGPPAVMAPVAWIFAVIFIGLDGGGQAELWTVLPERAGEPLAALANMTALTLGLVLHLTAGPRVAMHLSSDVVPTRDGESHVYAKGRCTRERESPALWPAACGALGPSSIAAGPCRRRSRWSRWSAPSGARANDLEERRATATLGPRGRPQ
ncbi:hypothetical protein [Streptomyces mayteni]